MTIAGIFVIIYLMSRGWLGRIIIVALIFFLVFVSAYAGIWAAIQFVKKTFENISGRGDVK